LVLSHHHTSSIIHPSAMDEWWWRSPRSIGSHHYNNNINNSLFIYFYVYILRDLPPTRTLGHYARGAPPILYVPMFPWKYFFSTKWDRSKEIKRESCLHKGEVFPYSFGNSP
jgi:hypothetical protein